MEDRDLDRSEEKERVGGDGRQEKRDKLVTLIKRMGTGSNFTVRKNC